MDTTVKAWGHVNRSSGSWWQDTGRERRDQNYSDHVAREAIRYGFKIRITPRRIREPLSKSGYNVIEIIQLLAYDSLDIPMIGLSEVHAEYVHHNATARIPYFERLARILAAYRTRIGRGEVDNDPMMPVINIFENNEKPSLAWAMQYGGDGDPFAGAWRASSCPFIMGRAIELMSQNRIVTGHPQSRRVSSMCDLELRATGARSLRIGVLSMLDRKAADRLRAWCDKRSFVMSRQMVDAAIESRDAWKRAADAVNA